MSSTGRDNLKANDNGWDKLWYRDSERLNRYRDYSTVNNHILERIDFQPVSTNTLGYGQQIQFELDNRADYMGKMILFVTRGPNTDNTCVNPRFEDFEGYSMIDRVEVNFENYSGLIFRGENMKYQMLREMDKDQRNVIAEMQNGYRGETERKKLATQLNTLAIDLLLPFAEIGKRLPIFAMSDKVKVTVVFKKLQECLRIDSGGSGAFALSNPKLRVSCTHELKDTTTEDWGRINQDGIPVKLLSKEYQLDLRVLNQTGSQRFPLRNIRNSVVKLDVTIRPRSSLDSQTTLNTMNLVRCKHLWLEDNGQIITPKFEMKDSADGSSVADYGTDKENHDIYPHGQHGLLIATIPFCEPELVVASKDNCFGSRQFSAYNNLELVLDWGSDSPGEVMRCDVSADIHNFMMFKDHTVYPAIKFQ
eukprot:TRINITY_DN9563_c0_g3_i2.p1 TRINITY_DN9563_c0_g3~~TRINITY_DN9563_c0_g3_i2.p1  ORF type:complete len:420 (+),score=70.41 TRINITY_DN9563_c0_g3_i2:1-1260(+)